MDRDTEREAEAEAEPEPEEDDVIMQLDGHGRLLSHYEGGADVSHSFGRPGE